MGAQVLSPGELGEARRHLQAEFRFIIKGAPGAYAVVEGERFPMEDGDLLGTPGPADGSFISDQESGTSGFAKDSSINTGSDARQFLNAADTVSTPELFRNCSIVG